MSRLIPALLVLLCACATPSPGMMGAARHRITLDGIDFVVFHKDMQAQVIRIGYLTRNRRPDVPALMQRAAAETTGCAVIPGSMTTRLPGDTGVALFDMRC